LFVLGDGAIGGKDAGGAIEGWWQPRPLLLCPRCRASYDLRETSDFRKLVTLSQTSKQNNLIVVNFEKVEEEWYCYQGRIGRSK
jgi:hypothetical protein